MKAQPQPAGRIAEMLRDARARTLELVEDLSDEQLLGPSLPIVNPLLWEIGHLAWFQEKWVLRHLRGEPPLRADADALYDSGAVAHDTRWDLPLPSRAATFDYMRTVLETILARVDRRGDLSEEETYFHLLGIFHEDMHGEAFAYTRQTLGYPRPRFAVKSSAEPAVGTGLVRGDVVIPAGTFLLGATPDLPFVFDNEKWVHAVEVGAYAIARSAVRQGEFAAFVESRGYERRELWSEAGWRWRESEGAKHPVYWMRDTGGRWLRRSYEAVAPLEEDLPVLHVNCFEADAYCRWAGRRLPTEAEWERAASVTPGDDPKRRFPWGDEPPTPGRANLDGTRGGTLPVGALAAGDSAFGCRQMIGNVWEWTQDDFLPFPGFVADPYNEYSQPWFGSHKVLRGGCWVTRSRLIRNTWRNFYTPDRRDVWAGFRTCALSPDAAS